jgi:hypothetical protein
LIDNHKYRYFNRVTNCVLKLRMHKWHIKCPKSIMVPELNTQLQWVRSTRSCNFTCKISAILTGNCVLCCHFNKFYIFTQLKFVKLYCKYNVILAEHTVASHTSSNITGKFCVFTNIHTKPGNANGKVLGIIWRLFTIKKKYLFSFWIHSNYFFFVNNSVKAIKKINLLNTTDA